jgi:ABC-type Co2+ transport system permease subunit
MHIESALITTGVAIATYAVSGSLIAFSGIKLRKERKLTRLEEKNTVNST